MTTENVLSEWVEYCERLHGRDDGVDLFAYRQFALFAAGVRDARLSDDAIWLIDRLGYDSSLKSP